MCSRFNFPSPLAGEGGAQRRMRGRSAFNFIALFTLKHTPHPSCAQGGAIHLLPQGEKDDFKGYLA